MSVYPRKPADYLAVDPWGDPSHWTGEQMRAAVRMLLISELKMALIPLPSGEMAEEAVLAGMDQYSEEVWDQVCRIRSVAERRQVEVD